MYDKMDTIYGRELRRQMWKGTIRKDNRMRKLEHFNDVNLSPEIIIDIQELGKRYSISQVVLFGSRARKTNGKKSDIDLMISTPDSTVQLDFIDSLEEIDTLLMFDVVNRKSFNYSSDLHEEIMRDGVILYEEV